MFQIIRDFVCKQGGQIHRGAFSCDNDTPERSLNSCLLLFKFLLSWDRLLIWIFSSSQSLKERFEPFWAVISKIATLHLRNSVKTGFIWICYLLNNSLGSINFIRIMIYKWLTEAILKLKFLCHFSFCINLE